MEKFLDLILIRMEKLVNFICTLNKLDFSNYLQKFKHWFGKQFF